MVRWMLGKLVIAVDRSEFSEFRGLVLATQRCHPTPEIRLNPLNIGAWFWHDALKHLYLVERS